MFRKKIKVFVYLIGFAILLVFSLSGKAKKHDQTQKPNILWIVADDLGTDLACYSEPLIKTPNLDKFASQSVKYENCHTVTAVCSPSRSAMVTGMYPVSINCHQHRTRDEAMLPLPEGVKVVSEFFEAAGYFTFNGKVEDKTKKGKYDYNFKTDYKIYDGTDWTQRKEGQPFFGQIQIHFPHRPFKQDKDNPIDASKVKLPPYWANHSLTRKDWALYLETIQIVDKQVGEVLKRLEDEGLSKNTYVFFIGDQGSPMVRHKQFLYQGGTNTPLIVRYPNGNFAGEVRTELVSNIDLAATSLKLAGIKIPSYMHGQNFLGNHKERKELYTMRDRRDETVDRIRAVRSGDFKLIKNFYPEKPYTQHNAYKLRRYPAIPLMKKMKEEGKLTPEQQPFFADKKPEYELYNIKNDPYELNNLANNPDFKKIKKNLVKKLNKWVKKYDLGTYPENKTETDFWKKRMAELEKKWMEKKKLSINPTYDEHINWWKKHYNIQD